MKGLDFLLLYVGGFVFVYIVWYSYGYSMPLCSSYFTGNLRKHQLFNAALWQVFLYDAKKQVI